MLSHLFNQGNQADPFELWLRKGIQLYLRDNTSMTEDQKNRLARLIYEMAPKPVTNIVHCKLLKLIVNSVCVYWNGTENSGYPLAVAIYHSALSNERGTVIEYLTDRDYVDLNKKEEMDLFDYWEEFNTIISRDWGRKSYPINRLINNIKFPSYAPKYDIKPLIIHWIQACALGYILDDCAWHSKNEPWIKQLVNGDMYNGLGSRFYSDFLKGSSYEFERLSDEIVAREIENTRIIRKLTTNPRIYHWAETKMDSILSEVDEWKQRWQEMEEKIERRRQAEQAEWERKMHEFIMRGILLEQQKRK